MLLDALEFAHRQHPELAGQALFVLGAGHHGAALGDQDLGVADRLSRRQVNVTGFDAEDIAGQIERADLATAVIQQAVGSHCAGNDLIEILGGLMLAINFVVAGKSHRRAHQAQRAFR